MRYLFTLCLLVFIVLPVPGCAREAEPILKIQEVTSPKGLTAWLVEDHSVPVIAVNFTFQNGGAINDPPEKQGLGRMVSNMMDEGAGDLESQAFQKALRDYSISLGYGAGRDDFGGSLKTLTKYKDKAFELLKLSLTKPRFDEEPLQRMRASNQSRIRSSISDPDWLAARLLNDRAYENDPYALNSGGTLSSLDKITAEDLREFHKTKLGKNNLIIAVAGDIDKAELEKMLDDVFASLPDVKIPMPPARIDLQNQGQTYLYEKDIPQTIIEMMQPGISRKDPRYHKAQVMNFILGSSGFGSRLMSEIREKRGLTYGIYTYFSNMDRFDGLAVSTSTENKNVGEMMSLIQAEWKKMKEAPPSEEEIQQAKNYLIGSLPLSLTSTDKIAGIVLSLRADDLPIDYLDQRKIAIENTSASDVQNLANELLDSSKMLTVLVGKPENVVATAITELPNVE